MFTPTDPLPVASAGALSNTLTVLVSSLQPPAEGSSLSQLFDKLSATGIEPIAVWDGRLAGLDGPPGTRVIGFLGSAVHALVQALHLGLGEPDAVLSSWVLSTRHVLRAAHARPGSWRLFDIEEAERSPQLLAEHLAGWGIDWKPSPRYAAASSLLTQELADAVVRARPVVRQLQSELAASCIPLEAFTAVGAPTGAERSDATRLWQEHSTVLLRLNEQKARLEANLRALASAEESRQAAIDSLESRLCVAQATLEAANGRCSDLAQQQARSQREVEAHCQELAAMTAQMLARRSQGKATVMETAARRDGLAETLRTETAIHQNLRTGLAAAKAAERGLQLELDALRQDQVELKRTAEMTCAESALVVAQLKTIQEQLTSERQTSHQIRQALAKEKETSAEALFQTASARGALEQQAEQFRVERDALHAGMRQLQNRIAQSDELLRAETERSETLGQRFEQEQALRHDVDSELATTRSELEQTSAERRLLLLHLHHLQDSLEAQAHPPPPETCEALALTAEQLQPPHRHVDLSLSGLALGQQNWPRVDLRLVEHSGRAGLLLWEDDAHRVLRAWRANGDEGGRKFLLLIPGDPEGLAVLNSLGAQDWKNLLGLVRLLVRLLADKTPQAARWHVQAQLLLQALTGLRPRLRYDERKLQVTSVDSLEAVLVNACLGERQLGDIVLQWLPQADRLRWVAPADPNKLALAGWPTSPDGDPEPTFELPVGTDQPASARRRRWAAALDEDRMLMLAALDALAGAARESAVTEPQVQVSQAAMVSQVERWRSQASQAIRSSRLRGRLRQLLGRG